MSQKTNREREAKGRGCWGEKRGKDREIGKRGRKGTKALESVS